MLPDSTNRCCYKGLSGQFRLAFELNTWKVSNADIHQICLLLSATRNATIFYFPSFYPCDPPYVTDELRQAESFKKSYEKMKTELDNLQKDMYRSVPFFSTRHKVGFKD